MIRYPEITLIVSVKNRLNHFMLTFPFNVSQVGINYELIYVNYNSTDNFTEKLINEIEERKVMFSKNLIRIKEVILKKDAHFNPRKSKNLGVSFSDINSKYLIFNDADTMLSMEYLSKWTRYTQTEVSFVTNRIQETKASKPKRIKEDVNYGNLIVSKKDYFKVGGFDESVNHYGGDDDDIFHRLKLKGLREINPYTFKEAGQYSIMHTDDVRLNHLKMKQRVNADDVFKEIYENKMFENKNREFLLNLNETQYDKDKFMTCLNVEEEIRYEMS